MLLLRRGPFRIGDYIDIGGTGGTIVNCSREPTRRINFSVGIDYSDDITAAQEIVMKVMAADSRVLRDPVPLAPVGALGASSVDIIVRCWVCNSNYWNVLFDLQKAVKLALDTGGITIPFPQRVVTLRQETGASISPTPNAPD